VDSDKMNAGGIEHAEEPVKFKLCL
jgi:hypothetical protein